jgi:hypothetical protein
MKITLRQLRSLIREMAFDRLSRMTNVSGDAHGAFGDQEISDERLQTEPGIWAGRKSSVEKYFKSKSWTKKAQGAYKNIQSKIWVIPNFSSGLEYWDSYRGNEILSFEEALPAIEVSDYTPEETKAHLNSGGTLWILNSDRITADFWPSPWMALHALFDDGDAYSGMTKDFTGPIDERLEDEGYDFSDILISHMTMKSATSGKLSPGNENDVISEIITQVIQTGGHLKLKPFDPNCCEVLSDMDENELLEYENRLNEFKSFIESLNIPQKFEQLISGKIFFISVYVGV